MLRLNNGLPSAIAVHRIVFQVCRKRLKGEIKIVRVKGRKAWLSLLPFAFQIQDKPRGIYPYGDVYFLNIRDQKAKISVKKPFFVAKPGLG
jgi:hypothetical protein